MCPGAVLSGRTPVFLSRTMLSSAALREVWRFGVGGGGGEGNLVQRTGALRVEEAKLEAGRVEPLGGLGDQVFGDQSLAHRIGQGVEAGGPDAAREVGAGLQAQARRSA